MEVDSVVQFLESRTILVTGATGFLAKVFVEKILRVQPNINKIYLLVRAADSQSASQRLHDEVIGKDLFKVLREKYGANFKHFIQEKLIPVPGEVTSGNLGIQDPSLLEKMCNEVEIITHSAAITKYDERYDVLLNVNTLGAMNVVNFAKRCARIRMLLHVSTAYVSGERAGLILEDPLKMGEALNGTPGLDIDDETKVVKEKLDELKANRASEKDTRIAMKILGLQRAKKYGWPNTYVFTKAMAEMVLDHMKENLPLVIFRPTVVTSTFKEPFPGWVEGIKTIDSLAVGYAKGQIKCFLGDPESTIDVIPVDFVVNAMIVAMATHAAKRSFNNETMIYQVGSSVANPIRFIFIQNYALRYFTKHPWIGKDGKAVKVGKVNVLGSMASFRRYMAINYLLPLKALELVNTVFCQYFQGYFLDLQSKINYVMRLIELYEPYLFFKGIYDDINTEKLRMTARESGIDTDVFYFDPRIICWEEYFMGTHLPGIVKYVFK